MADESKLSISTENNMFAYFLEDVWFTKRLREASWKKQNPIWQQFYSVFPFCELMHNFVSSRAIIITAAQKEHHPKLMGPSGFCWAHPISAFLSHSFIHKKIHIVTSDYISKRLLQY